MNTAEELTFVKDIATTTGTVLDPVYRCDYFSLVCDIIFDILYASPSIQVKKCNIILSVKLPLRPFPQIHEET